VRPTARDCKDLIWQISLGEYETSILINATSVFNCYRLQAVSVDTVTSVIIHCLRVLSLISLALLIREFIN
jgi:hypothetical protein